MTSSIKIKAMECSRAYSVSGQICNDMKGEYICYYTAKSAAGLIVGIERSGKHISICRVGQYLNTI